MQPHQRRFFDLARDCSVLRFGEFTLKSGRVSPYFFNAGLFNTGAALQTLAECYATTLESTTDDAAPLHCDMLFGPAYKGIALAATLATELARRGSDLPLAFNRKEAKAHGEGGSLIGAPLAGRVLIVDDVMTAGTAIRESITLIRNAGATPCGVLIALDRQERGQTGTRSAAQEVGDEFGIPVRAIAGLRELLDYTSGDPALGVHHAALLAYRQRYGSSG